MLYYTSSFSVLAMSVPCELSKADSKVRQGNKPHFTLAGYCQIPEKTTNFFKS